jgi:hypothetical protein
LYSKAKLNGTINIDQTHRIIRDQTDNVTEQGMRLIKTRGGAVCSFAIGPWDKNAFFWLVHEAAMELFAVFDHDWIVYRMLYNDICVAAGVPRELIGTKEHMKSKWCDLKVGCPIWMQQGMKSVFGRWFSHENKSEEVFPHLPALQLPLLYHGLKKAWWRNVFASPLATRFYITKTELDAELALLRGAADSDSEEDGIDDADLLAAAPVVADVSADGAFVKMTVAMSKVELERIKKAEGCRHTLHFISNSIADRRFMRLWQGMVAIEGPMKARCGKDLVRVKDLDGCLQFCFDNCRGVFSGMLCSTLDRLCDEELLYKLHFYDGSEKHAFSHEVEEETYVLSRLWAYSLGLVFSRWATLMEFRTFPKVFILLLTPDKEELGALLRMLKLWWEWMQYMEALAIVDKKAKDWYASLIVVDWVFVRSVFIQLEEMDFASVPACLLDDLEAYGWSQAGTVICENMMKVLATKSRHHPSRQLSRQSRYHAMHTSKLLSEYGRAETPITPAARAIAPKELPATLFSAKDHEFSLGLPLLQTMAEENASWVTASPLTYKQIPTTWAAFASVDGNFDAMRTSWLSKLANPGTVVWKRGTALDQSGGLVVGVGKDFFLCWKVTVSADPDRRHMFFTRNKYSLEDSGWHIIVINAEENLADWRVIDAKLVPSHVAATKWNKAFHGPVLTSPVNTGKSIAEFDARLAFAKLNFDQLKKLMRIAEVAVDELNKPVTEEDVVTLLIKHFIPTLTDDEIAKIVAMRDKKREILEQEYCTEMLDEHNIALLDGMFKGTDIGDETRAIKKEVAAKLKKYDAHRAGAPKPAEVTVVDGPVAAPTGSGSSSSSAAAVVIPPPIAAPREALPEGNLTPEMARRFMPDVIGCRIYMETKWDLRWYGSYQDGDTKIIKTKCFGGKTGLTDREAMMFVLSSIWEVHQGCCGAPCPYDFV